MKKHLFIMMVSLSILGACAPQTTTSVGVVESVDEVSFYPHQTGVIREYLPDNASTNEARFIQRILGPRSFAGQRYITTSVEGRGVDITSYRVYNNEGVFRYREDGPGYTMTLNPPIQEYPSPRNMAVGQTWRGSSEVTIQYTTSSNGSKDIFTTNYVYSVVDRREIGLENGDDILGRFNVFVINLEADRINSNGQVVGNIEQDIWFSPYTGEIRTKDGWLLTASNLHNLGTLSQLR